MSRVRTFFLEEAGECLATLTAAPPGGTELGTMHAAARRLRGNAQVARYSPVAEAALSLERRLKRLLLRQERWTDETTQMLEAEVAAVTRAVDAVRDGRIERESRTEEQMEDQPGTTEAEVAIEDLEFTGKAALARAAALKEPLESAITADEAVGLILEELFDLIRLGME